MLRHSMNDVLQLTVFDEQFITSIFNFISWNYVENKKILS